MMARIHLLPESKSLVNRGSKEPRRIPMQLGLYSQVAYTLLWGGPHPHDRGPSPKHIAGAWRWGLSLGGEAG